MYILAGFLTGAILGSLVKALADRSLTNKSFLGRSQCEYCKKSLAWYDLFPILSYIFLKGKCRYCQKKISMEYLLVEVVMGILIAYLFSTVIPAQAGIQLISKIFFITILAIVFLTDIKDMLIPDRIILPSIIIGLMLNLFMPDFLSSVGMGILIGGFFWSLIIITRGKGMGGGDVKLGAFMGIMLGFPQALFALMLAFITGAVFSLALVFGGKKHFKDAIPFGPFLVTGSLMMLFWGDKIMNWYLHLGT